LQLLLGVSGLKNSWRSCRLILLINLCLIIQFFLLILFELVHIIQWVSEALLI